MFLTVALPQGVFVVDPGFGAPEFLKVPPERVVYEALMGVARDRARVIPGWIIFLGAGLLFAIPFALVRLGLNASVAGAVLLTLLFQGSTAFTERLSLDKYPSYADYQRTPSRLWPWPRWP